MSRGFQIVPTRVNMTQLTPIVNGTDFDVYESACGAYSAAPGFLRCND